MSEILEPRSMRFQSNQRCVPCCFSMSFGMRNLLFGGEKGGTVSWAGRKDGFAGKHGKGDSLRPPIKHLAHVDT